MPASNDEASWGGRPSGARRRDKAIDVRRSTPFPRELAYHVAMAFLTIPYSEDLLLAMGRSPEQLERELRLLLAVKLFELRRVSGGKAAEVAGMSKLEFLDEVARLGVPTINLEEDQLKDELKGD